MVRERKNTDVRREEILDAALEVFSAYGFHGTSIKLLAREAGMTEGLLYHYFDGKQDLFKEVIKRFLAQRDSLIGTMVSALPTSEPSDLLTGLARGMLAFARHSDAGKFLRMVLRESPNLPDIDGKPIPLLIAGGIEAMTDIFAALQANRVFAAGHEPAFLARQFVGTLITQFIVQDVIGVEEFLPLDHDRFITQTTKIFLAGAAPKKGKT